VDSKKSKKNIELIERLINHNLKIIIFFQTDLTKYKILLTVMMGHYKNQETTIEKIIENLPSTISSRAHKLNCITEASARGYLIKEPSKTDLRKKNLIPSNDLVKEFEEYLKIRSNI
jgi:hypothetical protein